MPVTDITLNKIVDTIKAAAECHTMLNDVFVGEESSQGFNDKEKRELNYPYLWIDFAPASLVISDQKVIQTKIYNIVLFVADKQYDNIKNDVEILSDTEGILSDIIQYILTNKDLKEYTTASGTIPVTFGRDATKDGVFGCTATFPIRVRYVHCANTLPIPCDIIETKALHVWDSENLTILGTTTTANDYNNSGIRHHLINPSASNQPTYNAIDTNFNNLPSLSFDGVGHYLTKTFSDFLISETSGEIHSIVRGTTNRRILTLASADSIGNNYATAHSQNSFDYGHLFVQGGAGFNNSIRDTLGTKPNEEGTILISLISTGANYRIFLNGIEQVVSMGIGSNNGNWFNKVADRDDITIGASLTTVPFYAVQDWAFTGYYKLLTDLQRNNLMAQLRLKYGL